MEKIIIAGLRLLCEYIRTGQSGKAGWLPKLEALEKELDKVKAAKEK